MDGEVYRSSVGKLMTESRFSSNRLGNAKLTDKEHAMNVGKRLFEYYDKDKSSKIDEHEISNMMSDIYNCIGISFKPKDQDIKEFKDILDSDNDGKVSVMDIQSLMVKYLAK